QNDSISYHSNLYFLNSNQNFQPHWQVSNRYGIFDRSKQTEFVGLFGLAYQYNFGKKFIAETEVEFNLKSDISNSYFQQLYFNLYYGSLQFKVGKEAYTIGQYSEDLSSGSLFISNNSRPVPRIGIGFYNYTPIPLIEKYVEFKGVLNFGILDDDRSEYNGTDKPWYHEKFLYLRSKSLPVNLHVGLNHSALFGGTKSNGMKIETDLLATFFGEGSSKVGGGEETNAAGAHFGMYDLGINWKIKDVFFQVYYQIPFADGHSMQIKNNKDQLAGILVNFGTKSIISSINYEYINHTDQNGAGVPDAVFDGELVDLLKVEDPDQFMLEHFDTVTVGFTPHQLKAYSEKELNYGWEYGGRKDYYNNGLYPKGQSYHNYALGPSLILSKSDVDNFNPDFTDRYDKFFVSNRIIAHHLAFDGYFGNNFSYRTKLTYSKNYGSYAGANKGRYNWGSMEDP
ncbi:MAG: hypothetical protein KAK04_20050, partial [Cyclobacteriaceae bacterium]|nr:hypothetical protein [Cyclobacteriaceae bacterium]